MSLDIVSWRDCECPLWVETKLFPISRGCFIRILETRFRLEGKPCSKFLLEIYIYRGVPFLFFFSREKRISTLEKIKLFHAKNLFLAIAREFLSLFPPSFFKYSKRFTSGETLGRFLRKIIREIRCYTFRVSEFERRKILEKEERRIRRRIIRILFKRESISRGTLYSNYGGGRRCNGGPFQRSLRTSGARR